MANPLLKIGDVVFATKALVEHTNKIYKNSFQVTEGKAYTVISLHNSGSVYIKDDRNLKYGVSIERINAVQYKPYTRRLP